MTIDDIDVFWVLLCACLVWIMQAGFLCLETGLTRSKNNINVALKNICDNATSIFLFWLVGFSVAFGTPFSAPLDPESNFYFFQSTDNKLNAFFVFQAVFCSTCCTIVSGAAAERLRFALYPVLVAFIAAVIYPVLVNAAWGGQLIHNGLGFLAERGFYDFAGSTVVHSTGGWVALALVMIIGPRLGRFDKDGKPQPIQGSNLTLSSLGVLILWFGWLGFNGGSAYNFNADIGIILSNTLVAGSASLIATLLILFTRTRTPSAEDLINGALGGLVGITASANCVSSVSACLIGFGSAICVLIASRVLLRLRLDDVVGAIPVHLAAGIWGTLAAGIFGDLAMMKTGLTRLEQISAQGLGILFVGAWSFTIAYVVLKLIHRIWSLRVSTNDESIGLNIAEHGATSELYELIAFMKYQSDTGTLASSAPTDQFTETGVIGMAYNHVMDTLRNNDQKLKAMNRQLETANEDLKSYDHIVAHDLQNPISVIRSYASLIDQEGLDEQKRKQYLARIRRSSEDALVIVKELLNFAKTTGAIQNVERVDLQGLVSSAKLQLHPLIEERGPRFELDLALDEVTFNGFALQQVLVNLISNAIKYASPDRPPLIRVRSRHAAHADLIEVVDNGIGMDPGQLARVFEKHSRFVTTAEGYGLGMYAVKRLVESGGGRITLDSVPGEGTTVTLHLKPSPIPDPASAAGSTGAREASIHARA